MHDLVERTRIDEAFKAKVAQFEDLAADAIQRMPKFAEGLISKEDHIYDKHLKKVAVDQIADRKVPKRFESLTS